MITRPDIAVIGPKELVAFPRLNVFDIPAKIDTGADSSAIWVSNLSVSNEGLKFHLFGPESHLYTGKNLTVETYETTRVKNSSGSKEKRYKIRLVILVNGRNIRAWFTLADRSSMKYPVLLGRKLLSNKFVVDVSKTSLSKENTRMKKKILIIADENDNSKLLKSTYQNIFEDKASVEVRTLQDFEFQLSSETYEINDSLDHIDIKSYDLVYIKANKKPKLLSIIAQYLIFYKVTMINKPSLNNYGKDNLTILSHLSQFNVPIPDTYFVARQNLKSLIKTNKDLELPLILKEESSRRKITRLVIEKISDLKKLDDYPNLTFFCQPLIDHEGSYRAYIFGGKLRFISFVDKEGNEELFTNKDETFRTIKEISSVTARAVNLELGAVELIKSKDKNKFIVLSIDKDINFLNDKNSKQKQKQFINYIDKYLNR